MDRDLVEAAQRGDREAYVDLIRARGDRLFALAQRMLRDVDRAYRFPRLSCSRSIASKSALKLPTPKPREPWRSMISKKNVGRS